MVESGVVALPARILTEFVGVLPLGVVEMDQTNEGEMSLSSGGMKAKFQIMPPNDFPKMGPETEGAAMGKIPAADFVTVWQKLEYATSRDLARPILTGVLWELAKGKLVATDGYRLSVINRPELKFKLDQETMVVSGLFWGMAAKTIEDLNQPTITASVNLETRQLILTGEDLVVTGRLLEGEYPAYQAILPKGEAAGGTFEKESLLQAVKGAMIFAKDAAQIVKFSFEEKGLRVEAATEQGGSNAMVSGEMVGEKIVTAFNGKFVIDFLNHTNAARVVIRVDDPLKPGLFSEEGNADYKHVIMPIRLKG